MAILKQRALICRLFAIGVFTGSLATAQTPVSTPLTSEQDHQNMMDQLGIKALRPGPSGDEKAPNHANYDESKANPYPNVPDPLTMNDGEKVTTAEMWWSKRRPEIVEMYSKYVYGRVPANVPKVTWTVNTVDHEMIGFTPVIAKDVEGVVDNSSDPAISVHIHMMVVLPARAKGPVPVLMMFGRAAFPYPNEPSGSDLDKINKAWETVLLQQDPSLKQVFEQHPAWQPVKGTPFQFPQLNEDGGLPNTWQLAAAGWGFVLFDPAGLDSPEELSVWSTKASRANPKTGVHCVRGHGAPAAGSTISRPIPPSMQSTSASRACRATARRHWSQWRSIRDSQWCWSVLPGKGELRSCAAILEKQWKA
jgi:hypothetical protein